VNRYPRKAKNMMTDLTARGPRLGASVLLCLLLGSCAIEEVVPVSWSFSFACPRDAERTELVGLQVGKGGCPIGESVVFEVVKPMSNSPDARPQGLPAGLYAFQGTAWDADGQPIATRCESVEIPEKQVIELALSGAGGCTATGVDEDAGSVGSEDSGVDFEDAGREDSGVNPMDDAGPQDSGSQVAVPDAGEPDAGPALDDVCAVANPTLEKGGVILFADRETDFRCSANKKYRFGFDDEGALVLRNSEGVLWSTGPTTLTVGAEVYRAVKVILQLDSNFLVKTDRAIPDVSASGTLWSSKTMRPSVNGVPHPEQQASLTVTDDGRVMIIAPTTPPAVLWSKP